MFPNYSASSIKRLQLIQNKALRLAPGCHTAASVDHLHWEALELPVGDHMRLLSAQFLARALQPDHPSHAYVTRPSGRRKMKHTLRSKVSEEVQPYLDENGQIAPSTCRSTINNIHTDVVNSVKASLGPNHVLGVKPPFVSKHEKHLPRATRSLLSQLRSGFCSKLMDFQHRIGRSTSSACPECDMGVHSVAHLFDCPRHPTPLTTLDLWKQPRDVAVFLSGLPSFASIPPPPPPPPPRGRRRGRPPATPPRPPDGALNLSDSSLFSSFSLPSNFSLSSSLSFSSPSTSFS